jgi:hypothetical protein
LKDGFREEALNPSCRIRTSDRNFEDVEAVDAAATIKREQASHAALTSRLCAAAQVSCEATMVKIFATEAARRVIDMKNPVRGRFTRQAMAGPATAVKCMYIIIVFIYMRDDVGSCFKSLRCQNSAAQG